MGSDRPSAFRMLAVTCSGTSSFKVRHVYKHRLGNCLMYSRVCHRDKLTCESMENEPLGSRV